MRSLACDSASLLARAHTRIVCVCALACGSASVLMGVSIQAYKGQTPRVPKCNISCAQGGFYSYSIVNDAVCALCGIATYTSNKDSNGSAYLCTSMPVYMPRMCCRNQRFIHKLSILYSSIDEYSGHRRLQRLIINSFLLHKQHLSLSLSGCRQPWTT